MQLGLVTYLLGKDWDVATLIENCTNTGFQGVELRSTHAHGVESDLSNALDVNSEVPEIPPNQ